MSNKKTAAPANAQCDEPQDETIEIRPEDVETTPEPDAEAEESEAADGEESTSELEAAIAEATEYKDRWMRSVAELENYRRRTAREYEQLQIRAGERVLQHFLEPVDNLARGIESAKASADKLREGDGEGPSEEMEAFIQGMEMAYNQLMQALEREQVKVMEPVGEPFDPNHHEALMMTESADAPPNTVIGVVNRGYWMGDRVLRHAKVVVSKAAAEEQSNSEEE